MTVYKEVGRQLKVIHLWANNQSLNRLCIRLDDRSGWMFGFSSPKNWHKGDTVEVLSTSSGYKLRNVIQGKAESARFLGYAED